MKRLIFAGLVMALFSGNTVFAQSNNSYSDDVYYNGSQAERDAQADAKKQKKQRQTQTQDQEEQYNSSSDGYTDNGYDGDARVYNGSYNTEDNEYIDYDDDSYTSRMRRFYHPMSSVGYWGSVYSPFWADPFYTNPYYGWGSWYTPGISIGIGFGSGFGWGGGPYWNNCWGMNTWFGYGGFGNWYSPYYGGWGGWGFGSGYWNGYYAGLYDGRYGGGGMYNPIRTVNYGPRSNRVGLTSVGAYGRGARMTSVDRSANMVQPFNRSANTNLNGNTGSRRVQFQNDNTNNRRSFNSTDRDRTGSRDAINLDRSNVRVFDGDNNNRSIRQVTPDNSGDQRRGGFFNRGNSNSSNVDRSFQRNEAQPSRNFERSSQPTRNFSSPAPSRSYSNPGFSSPSRSSGGFGGGGGSRMSSGGGGRGR